jgi:hypothetical protein
MKDKRKEAMKEDSAVLDEAVVEETWQNLL